MKCHEMVGFSSSGCANLFFAGLAYQNSKELNQEGKPW
jgi:hypothetical protein